MLLPFQDRAEAGRLLGAELASRKLANVVVLALPRGGVPVAAEVASALHAPLDVIVVRKLGVPWQPELAMGAICGITRILDFEEIDALHISRARIEKVTARETVEMERREHLYRSGRPALDVLGKTVVLVDDGLATGATMAAAARHMKSLHPAKVIVAAPVASYDARHRLSRETDERICLASPDPFVAVGQWYSNFDQVSDAQVQEIMFRFAKT